MGWDSHGTGWDGSAGRRGAVCAGSESRWGRVIATRPLLLLLARSNLRPFRQRPSTVASCSVSTDATKLDVLP